MIARSRPRTADIRRDRRPELQEPPPDRLVGCVNTSLGQQFLDIPKGQCEPGIEPDRVADDFWREAVALKRYRSHPMMLIGDEPQSYPSYRDIARRKYQLVCLPVNDSDGSYEAELRERNPKEAAWLDALLEGRPVTPPL